MEGRGARGLLDRWRTRATPDASLGRTGTAFGLLGASLLLLLLGLGLLIAADAGPETSYGLREAAIVAIASALPMFLLGVVLALPAGIASKVAASVGTGLGVSAVLLFAYWYPDAWSRTVEAPNIFAILYYLLGTSLLAAGGAGAVASYFIQRLAPQAEATGRVDPYDRAPTSEEIEADLAWAEKQGWSWGGVRRTATGVRIRISDEAEQVDVVNLGRLKAETRPSGRQVHEAVAALSGLRGATRPVEGGDAPRGQVEALRALRQQRAQEEAERRSKWYYRFWDWLTG